ncbi:trigger factor [Hydrogenobaculum sp.]|nr:MAG: trigger factor [Hydrogenobaculum sp.]PMP93387.1 MAG: trigger factor [Hydrogenobaculum sp.]
MAFTITKEEGIFRDFAFDVEGKELEQAYRTILNELKANAEVDGFRKGKAPEWIIKSKFKNYILEALVEDFAKKAYESAKEMGFDVMDIKINLENSKFSEKEMKLTMEGYIEIFPVIESDKLKDLEGVELEIPSFELKDEMVEEAIKYALEDKATLEPKEGPIEEDDYVVIDYTVVDKQDGEKVNQKLSGVLKELGLREDLYKEILGKKEQDVVKLENVPIQETEDENAPKVDIEAKIESVKKKVYPELTDELAKELNLGENVQEARENIKKRLQTYLEGKKEEAKIDALTKYLLEEYKDITEVSRTEAIRIANLVYEEELNRLNNMFDLSSFDEETLKVIEKSAYDKSVKEGITSAKTRSIFVSYAKKFGIEVTDEDIKKYIDEQVEAYKDMLPEHQKDEESLKRLRENIENYFLREDRKSVLIKDILASKAMDKLLEMVKFKENTSLKEENVE